MPARWNHLIRHGLLGTTLLTLASTGTAGAEPCDSITDRSIGIVLGMDFAPRVRLMGGIEVRRCLGDRGELFARLELGRGARLIGGSRIRPLEDANDDGDAEKLGMEAGLALESDGNLGAHLAATYGYHFAYLAAQGLFPLSGRERPARGSMLFGLSPWSTSQPVVTAGRPLISDGRLLRPGIASLPVMRAAEDRAVRDHFAASAQLELSSVWTFLRLAAELAAVGAPAALIARALDAADDEVRHAELCAAAAGGVELAPLAITAARPRFVARCERALATLAREAWLEGCHDEAAAADEARRVAAETDGAVAGMLAAIARDEQRHAELSWAVLGWLFEVAPATTRTATTARPPARAAADRPFDPALLRRGVPSPKISRAARADAAIAARARHAALAG